MTNPFLTHYPPSFDGYKDPYGRPIYGQNPFGHLLPPNVSLYPPQYYSNVAPPTWPSLEEPYANQLMNSWNHNPDHYQPQFWNNQYPEYVGNHFKNGYQGAPGQLWVPPSQNSHAFPVTSMSVITRSKKPSNSERASNATPPQPRKPRSKHSTTPSIMEVPATPTVLTTPTLPPTNPIVVTSTQNTVSPVRFHTPNASPPNPPNKDNGDDKGPHSVYFPTIPRSKICPISP